MINLLKQLFHFLGSIYFAITLIGLTAIAVVMGTLLESLSDSHQFAAQWTYEHPLFLLLLSLLFINILFSALRRWPFKKRHIPFLMTHFGLLMIISGTILKNRLGLQGHLSVWEGTGNQQVLLPHTHALWLEKKGGDSKTLLGSVIPLNNFHHNVLYPAHFPNLKCKVIGYTPHVQEQLETWIKGSKAYVSGLPPLEVQTWTPDQPLPSRTSTHLMTASQSWDLLALQAAHVQQALEQTYLARLTLRLATKGERSSTLEIPLQKALQEPFSFNSKEWSASLQLSSVAENEEASTLCLQTQLREDSPQEKFVIALQGQESLHVKQDPFYGAGSPLTIDLIRPNPLLCFIDDDQGNTFLYAFDTHGRIYGELFSQSQLRTLVAYDQGFGGYAVQANLPIPSFPASRQDQELADAYELTKQLEQALVNHPSLAPPLHFFEQACNQAHVDFAKTFVQFLVEWNQTSSLLFHPIRPLPESLELALKALDWEQVSAVDQQASQWTRQLLDQLEGALKQEGNLLTILARQHWPFMDDLQRAVQQPQTASPLNLLAQQIASLIPHLPSLQLPFFLNTHERAHLLSAYFRTYGIDYPSLFPSLNSDKSPLDRLEAYWRAHSTSEEQLTTQRTLILETPLTNRILPEEPPQKVEDQRPGIVLEFQQGRDKQMLALAYDTSEVGLKWPILKGTYTVRFQPQCKELPYRIRLRQARQIPYPQSSQIYSYESDLLISEKDQEPIAQTLSMNHVYETWDGYRFYLSGIGTSADQSLKRIQLVVNHDPAKYFVTYPGALLVFLGIILLFWSRPYRKK